MEPLLGHGADIYHLDKVSGEGIYEVSPPQYSYLSSVVGVVGIYRHAYIRGHKNSIIVRTDTEMLSLIMSSLEW